MLDELWFRAAMNNRGWKTLARALILAHTGMRPSQMMRLDPELHIRPYLDDDMAMVEVPSGKGSYATLLRRAGADIAGIQELLGHKSPKTTQRYAMVVPEKLVAATRRAEEQWTQSRTKGGNSVEPGSARAAIRKT